MFVTIDPGQHSGFAIYSLTTGLVACGTGDPRKSLRHVVTTADSENVIDDAWVEYPVIYPRSPARPNDIIKLAVNAGEWGGLYRSLGVAVHYVEPATWKGQIDKLNHHPIIFGLLTPDERDVLVNAPAKKIKRRKPKWSHDGLSEDMLDAVGLALWVARRWGRR